MNKSIVDAQLQIESAIKMLDARHSRAEAVAITHLETAQLWLLKAAKDAPKEKPEPEGPQPTIVIQDPCSVEPLASAPWYIRLAAGCL